MQIIKDRGIVEDAWLHVDDDAQIPATGDVTVSLSRWQADKATLTAHAGLVGVRLAPEDEASALTGDLDKLALVAVQFPKFTDGRGYTTARLLRERMSYRGELRAMGYVLRDQIFYLHRVGFNAFELAPGKSLTDALEGFGDFTVTYQGASAP